MSSPSAAFDRLAPVYADLWSNTPIGRLQRDAVLRKVRPLFRAGDFVLDLGCGTGDDALDLARNGVRVTGIDSSAGMVRIARDRGVDARHLSMEQSGSLGMRFDGVISNFGAMNCVERLADLREPLADVVRPQGWMAFCFLNRVCVWESVWHGSKGMFRKAVRRWRGEAHALGTRIFYPSVRDIESSFRPHFRLERRVGIGVFVPPSYIDAVPARTLSGLAAMDRMTSWAPVMRALGDHQLFIFRRS
jgi:ubiquinone/menaquinone biosynthesis C-methylase UbiE